MRNQTTIRILGLLVLVCVAIGIGCNNDNPSNNQTLPVVSGMTPSQVALGQQNVNGKIQGQNLSGVTAINLGASIQVLSFRSLNASEIDLVFSVDANAQPGPRTISITTAGGTGTSTSVFSVQNNRAPVAAFVIEPRTGSKNVDIQFDASGSTDQGGSITKYQWNFGDGKTVSGKIVTHKYTTAGTFAVVLTVTDNQQATGSTRRNLDVINNRPPAAHFSVSPASGNTNTEFTFDGSKSTDIDGHIALYSWNFGDGKKDEGKVVKHTFADAKTFTVELTVSDNLDATALLTKDVEVSAGGGGGGGGGCSASPDEIFDAENVDCGGFNGQKFTVCSVQGSIMITNTVLSRCPGRCGEVRRKADGIREFVGDIDRIDGNRVTMDYGHLGSGTRPRPGEHLMAIWLGCK